MASKSLEEKSVRLQQILQKISKSKSKAITVDEAIEKREEQKLDDELYEKLRKAELAYNRSRQGIKQKKILKNGVLTFDDLMTLDTSSETEKTAILFLFKILTMMISLFCSLGIIIISLIVYFAEDEVQLLHEISNGGSNILKQELSEIAVLVPFIVQVFVSAVNIYLITSDSPVEVWYYIRPKHNGIKQISILMMIQCAILIVVAYLSRFDITHIYHIGSNFFTLLQIIAMYLHGKSKLTDTNDNAKKIYELNGDSKGTLFKTKDHKYSKVDQHIN